MKNKQTGDTAVMEKAIESNVLSVDQYAEQLMDNLFEGIEHSLETGEVLEEEVAPAPTTVQTFAAATAAPLSVLEAPDSSLPEAALQSSEEEADAIASAPSLPATQPDWSLRLLWAAALVSCVGAIALCISNWGSYKALFQQVTGQPPAPEVVATAPTEAPNQEFANYIQQSLEALAAQKPAAAPLAGLTNPAAPVVAQVPALPTAPAAPTVPGGLSATAAAQPTTILERVYIPVYQTPQGLVPVVPGVPVPGLTNGLATNGTVLPVQTAVAPGTVVQPGSAIAPSASALGAPTSPPAQAATTGTAIAAQPLTTTEHTLVGLLELGDSSAGLFEVSGVTRRFSLGERIGSSGWTLVDVKNSEAIVRRNGELRSIFVGQTF